MTTRQPTERPANPDGKAQRPRLSRQAIQRGLVQPSRRHDLEDKQR